MSRLSLVMLACGWVLVCGTSVGGEGTPAVLPKVTVAPGGRTLQTADGKPFVPIGVNYFRPHTGWAPQLWKQFDPEATARDFAHLKRLGGNCVRVFLSFGSFFQKADALEPEGLAKLDRLLALAEEAGLYVHPTGPDHWEGQPGWAQGDRYADEKLLVAQETFWRLLAARYRGRNVLFAYDLLNEPSVQWDTPAMREKWNRWLDRRYGSAERAAEAWGVAAERLRWGNEPAPAIGPTRSKRSGASAAAHPTAKQILDYQHFREEIADAWTRRQTQAIKASDPAALVTVGMIQWSVPALLPGLQHYAAFRPARQAKWLDFLEVHFYPLAGGFYAYRNDDEEMRNLAYLESVVREVASPGRPVVLAEFGWYGGGRLTIDGGVHPPADEASQARWCRNAIETTWGLATGWLNWGFYDHPQARDVTELTGLLTVDGRPKRWAVEFEAVARRMAGQRMPPASLGPRPTLDWDRCVSDPQAAGKFLADYTKAFQASRKAAVK